MMDWSSSGEANFHSWVGHYAVTSDALKGDLPINQFFSSFQNLNHLRAWPQFPMNTLFDASPAQLSQVPLHLIRPDPAQPRKVFDPDALADLATSIKVVGILQPILVCKESDGQHTILYGERRWRAAKLAGLDSVTCLVLLSRTNKHTRWVVQCSENTHHRDLTPMEYVDAISDMRSSGLGTAAISDALGKRPDWVRGHELAANPAYRALFESGRMRSVDVLLHFRSLPGEARRELLDSGDLITSTRCARMREKYRQIEGKSLASTPTTPALTCSREPNTGFEYAVHPLESNHGFHETGKHDIKVEPGRAEPVSDHTIVSLTIPAAWIEEAGSVDAIRRIAMAALTHSRSTGWKTA